MSDINSWEHNKSILSRAAGCPRILFNGITDALPDVRARTHPVGGLLLQLAAAGGRLAQGLAAGGVLGGQERWLLAKRQPF